MSAGGTMAPEAIGAAAPWPRDTSPRPHGWHVIAEIDLARMLTRHSEQRQLCDALEAVADDLPRLPAEADVALLGRRLAGFADIGQAEDRIFARLALENSAEAEGLAEAVARWRLLDALHAQDLADILVAGDSDEDACRTDRLAYMLRCFFEGCRRTIALRETAILLLGRPRLTKAATASLRTSLARA